MKVILKRDIYDWKSGVKYDAEPIFLDGEQKVQVHLPGTVICIAVRWDDIETAE
jgi:hypothetical protein